MRRTLLLLAGLPLGLACAPAAADSAPATTRAASSTPVVTRRLASGAYRDVFHPARGAQEFTLSWHGLRQQGEVVTLNGQALTTPRDYLLDPVRGTLTLRVPVPAVSVLSVAYRTQAYLAAAGAGSNPAPADRGIATVADRLRNESMGDAGRTRLAMPAPNGGGALDQSAPKDEALSGLKVTELRQQLDGSSGSVTYVRADALYPGSVLDEREEFGTHLDLHPSARSRFVFDDYMSSGSLFADTPESVERQRLLLEQTWDKSTAQLMWEHQRSDQFGVANALDALSLSATHSFGHNTAAEGFFATENSLYLGTETRSLLTIKQLLGSVAEAQASALYRTSTSSGNTLESALRFFAHPGATDISAGFQESVSNRYGTYQRAFTDVTASLSKQLQVMGEFSQRVSSQFGNVNTYGFGMAARPNTHTLLEAAFSDSVGDKSGRTQSETVRLNMDPSAALKVQLGYDLLHSSKDGWSENALWAVEAGGRRYIKLEGYSGLHTAADKALYNDAMYRLEVRPVGLLKLSGSLRQVENDADRHAIAGVGAAVKLARVLEVSALARQSVLSAVPDPSPPGHDLIFALAPVSGFRVFGQYTYRPEDERGALLDQVRRSVGLETRLGSFGLQGSVSRMEGVLAPDPGQRMDFLASLSFSTGTRLYGGIRLEEGLTLGTQKSQVYRLGISQSAGPSLFVLLEAQVGRLIGPTGEQAWDPDETRAQARLGVRF